MINAIKADFLFSKGQKEAKIGDWAKSVVYFDRALSLNPKNSGIYLHKALSLSRQNKGPDALDAMKEAIALRPENFANYLFRGVIFFDLSDYDNASINFGKALNLSPNNSMLKCYLALTLLYKNEKISEAYEILLSNIQNTNSECKARFSVFCEGYLQKHRNIARSLEDIYFAKSNLSDNKSQTKFFNTIFDKLSLFYIYLSGIFNESKKKHYLHQFVAKQKLYEGDINRATQELKESLSYSYEFNEALSDLINIYFYQKDFQSVFESINQLEEFKDVKKWIFNLVNQKNEREQTIAELKNHLTLALVLALYHYHTGDYKKAIDIFSVIRKNFSDDFYNNYHLGLSYLGFGDSEKALTYFRMAFQQLHQNAEKLRLEEMIRVNRIVSDIPQH